MIEDSQANGFVEIPDDVITGTYYVRAYTKYMRNAGPESLPVLVSELLIRNARIFIGFRYNGVSGNGRSSGC